MHLPTGGDLGTIAKLGPLDRIFSCALVRGVLTHMLLLLSLLLLVLSPVVSAKSVCVVSVSDMMFIHV